MAEPVPAAPDQPAAPAEGEGEPQIEGHPITQVWLTDRSRIQQGRLVCKRARYLEYHSGPTTYGIRRKAQALPLVTGQYVHKIMEALVRGWGEMGEAQVREVIQGEALRYRKRCAARGYLDMLEADPEQKAEVNRVVDEQAALVEGMGWALALHWLPSLMETWEPVLVEEEMLLPIAPSGNEFASAAPQAPIVQMVRPDLVLRRKIDGALAQVEAKTVGGYLGLPGWRKQWEDSAQLMLTKVAIERRLAATGGAGVPISFAYVFALDKGRRSAEKSSGLMRQWSPFVYAYHRAANPPMVEEDWQLRWEWKDPETGATRKLGKGYERVAIHTFPFPGGQRPEWMSNTEYWLRSLPADEVMGQHEILGPYDFLNHAQEGILVGIAAEEEEWQGHLWAIFDAGEKVGWEEENPAFQKALAIHAPQSWNCHLYGKDCQFLPICRREPGWEAPSEDSRYEARRPHHEPEIAQAKAKGIELPEEQEEDEEATV